MIYFALSRRNKDRKGLIAVYITFSFAFPFIIFGRTVQTYFLDDIKYYDFASIICYLIMLIVFIEFTVMAINDYRKGKLKKQTLFGLFLGWPCVIFFLLIVFGVLKHR